MVMGIVAGTLGLVVGLRGYFLFSSLVATFALVPAIAGVVGAGIVRSQPKKGSVLMAVAGLVIICVMFLTYGKLFGSEIRSELIPPAALFFVGAILGHQSSNQN